MIHSSRSILRRCLSRKAGFNSSLFRRSFSSSSSSFDYDLVVIGGGSGGLAAAKEAKKVNPDLKVACFDYVEPTSHGTSWGIGGTCVNVGCIPKKLMHHASLLGHNLAGFAKDFGWDIDLKNHDWTAMQAGIGDYIRMLNFSYRTGLVTNGVEYINAHASFVDHHTIAYRDRKGGETNISASNILIATGCRPRLPDNVPGVELCITSDDLFWLNKDPGKTLVIGGGYVAMECAGFLQGLGNDVSAMVRSSFLRQFDSQCAHMVGELMERSGIKFTPNTDLVSFTKTGKNVSSDQHQIQVDWKNNGTEHSEIFDTVIMAIGRDACVNGLNLDKAGVETHQGKILVDELERTTTPHIFAVGDVATAIDKARPELTPVAILAGRKLSKRLFEANDQLRPAAMDYNTVSTAVFTPTEYAFIGLSTEEAERAVEDGGIGHDNVDVYWSRFGTLEISPTHAHSNQAKTDAFLNQNFWERKHALNNNLEWEGESVFGYFEDVYIEGHPGVVGEITNADEDYHVDGTRVYDVMLLDDEGKEIEEVKAVEGRNLYPGPKLAELRHELYSKANCLAKLVVDKRDQKVVGIHFVGPNAGEVMQGLALAFAKGLNKSDFDEMVGIHPTAAEEFAVLEITRSSGQPFLKAAGCGGGSCG